MPPPATKVLRDCIAAARNAVAIAACEKQQQATLKVGIERLSAAIRTRLDARERLVFDRSSTAWQTFLEREIAMLDLSLEKRGDGLGASLRPGAITLLFEQREQQLREHLHNLSATRPAVTGAGR